MVALVWLLLLPPFCVTPIDASSTLVLHNSALLLDFVPYTVLILLFWSILHSFTPSFFSDEVLALRRGVTRPPIGLRRGAHHEETPQKPFAQARPKVE